MRLLRGHRPQEGDCRKRAKDEASKPAGSVKAVEAEGHVEAITEFYRVATTVVSEGLSETVFLS